MDQVFMHKYLLMLSQVPEDKLRKILYYTLCSADMDGSLDMFFFSARWFIFRWSQTKLAFVQ